MYERGADRTIAGIAAYNIAVAMAVAWAACVSRLVWSEIFAVFKADLAKLTIKRATFTISGRSLSPDRFLPGPGRRRRGARGATHPDGRLARTTPSLVCTTYMTAGRM